MANALRERLRIRKGFARIALLFVPYFAWWAYQGRTNYQASEAYEELRQQAMQAGNFQAESAWFSARNNAIDAFEQSLLWGVYIPAGLLAAIAISYWVYRGFRPSR